MSHKDGKRKFQQAKGNDKLNKTCRERTHSHQEWHLNRIREAKATLTQDSGKLEQRRTYGRHENRAEQPQGPAWNAEDKWKGLGLQWFLYLQHLARRRPCGHNNLNHVVDRFNSFLHYNDNQLFNQWTRCINYIIN